MLIEILCHGDLWECKQILIVTIKKNRDFEITQFKGGILLLDTLIEELDTTFARTSFFVITEMHKKNLPNGYRVVPTVTPSVAGTNLDSTFESSLITLSFDSLPPVLVKVS